MTICAEQTAPHEAIDAGMPALVGHLPRPRIDLKAASDALGDLAQSLSDMRSGVAAAMRQLDIFNPMFSVDYFDAKLATLRFQMKHKGRPGWRGLPLTQSRHFQALSRRR